MSEQQPHREASGGVPKRNAEAYHHMDIADSRLTPELVLPEGGGVPEKEAEQLIREVDEFLAEREVYSQKELQFLLQKIDTALAINNDPKAREIRESLVRKFGDDAKR